MMPPYLAEGINRSYYLRSLHQHFSPPNPNLWIEILPGAVLIASLLVAAWLAWRWQRWRGEQGEMSPAALYRYTLARLHLSAGDVWWLWRLAKTVRIPHPTALLISPELYDEAVKRFCESSGLLGSRKRAESQFTAIRARLFTGQ